MTLGTLPPQTPPVDPFADRVAVVTGAAGGIGRALARRLLERGARVVAADVEAAALAATTTELGTLGTVVPAVVDVRDPGALDALAARVAAEVGVATLIFANAGVSTSGPTWEITPDDWRWTLEVNVLGVAHTVRAFVPPLVASGRAGHVCITGSIAGFLAQPGFGAYNATKHAVTGLAETLATDLREAGHPIGVTLLAPWFVRTRLAESDRNRPADLAPATPRGEFMEAVGARLGGWRHTTQEPEEIADLALAAVADGRFTVFAYPPSADAARRRIETLVAGGIPGPYLPDGP